MSGRVAPSQDNKHHPGQLAPSQNNKKDPRTVSTITLRRTGNSQGSLFYYSLATGQRLTRWSCTSIIMSDEVIDRLHYIAEQQRCPESFTFTRIDGIEIPPMDDDAALVEDDIQEDDVIVEAVENAAVDANDEEEPPEQQYQAPI